MTVWAVRSAFACALRGRIWLPFLAIAGIQLLLLVLLLNFHHALVSPALVPLISGLTGAGATHYPNFFLGLPFMFSRITLVVSVLATCVMIGAASVLFAQAFGRAESLSPWKVSLKRYPSLVLVTALLAACLVGIPYLSVLLPQDLMLQNSMVRWGARFGLLFLSILVQSLFIYSAAWILLRNERVLPALTKSLQLTRATFLSTFAVVAAPALILFPIGFLASKSDLFVTKFRPETTTGLIVGQVVLEIVLGFLLVGAITRIFLYQTEETA